MKKLTFIFLVLVLSSNFLYAQIKLDSKLKREIVASSSRDYIDAEKLVIFPILGSDSVFVANEDYTCLPYDILTIRDRSYPTGDYGDMLLVNNSEWTILTVSQSYSDFIQEVLDYFEINDNIDKRLLPIYIQKITKRYLIEYRGNDQSGPWRSWFGQKPQDTIALQYGKYLDMNDFRNNDLDGEKAIERRHKKADNIFEHIWNYYF